MHRPPRPRLALIALVLVVALLPSCSIGDDGAPPPSGPEGDGVPGTGELKTPAEALPALDRLRVGRDGPRAAIVDDAGREIVLRGSTLTALADLAQPDPERAPTRPPTDADWDQMAAQGASVVRLAVSWSALEPERGQVDLGYVQRIQQAVEAAAARRIYTVIDMHQDAWSRATASPPDVRCPEGTVPAVGGSGAPGWATLFDDASTCHPEGDPAAAPAVQAAFRSFDEDRDGIRTAYAATWRVLATAFAAEPAVAGFDLVDEHPLVTDGPTAEAQYSDLLAATTTAIREGELFGGGFPHLLFVQPMVGFPAPGALPRVGFTPDDQVVYAPHVQGQVVGPAGLSPEQALELHAGVASERGWPLWVGAYGIGSLDPGALDQLTLVAVAQDEALVGGAADRWRRWCGDPATIGVPGQVPAGDQVEVNVVSCPDDVDRGPAEPILRVVARAFPRASPGRLTEVSSDPTRGTLQVEGRIVDDLAALGDAVVWIPGEARPRVVGSGVSEPVLTHVRGGWYATMAVEDSPYRIEVR